MDDENIYSGIELTLQCIATSAVKISVESVVESLVSRYESQFDAKRQLKETNALDEMEISENGPDVCLKVVNYRYLTGNHYMGNLRSQEVRKKMPP